MHRQDRGEAEYEIQDRTVKVVNDRLAVFESRYDFMEASKKSAGKLSHPHPQIELPQAALWDEIMQAHHVQAAKALLQTYIDVFVELEQKVIAVTDKKALQKHDKAIKAQREEILKLRSDLNKEIAAAILASPADNSRGMKIKLKCFYDHIKAELGIDLHVNVLTEKGQSPAVLLHQIKEAVSHFPDKASKKAFTEALKALDKENKLIEKQEATSEKKAVSLPQTETADIPQPIVGPPLDDYPDIGDKLGRLGLNMNTAPELESFVANVSNLDPNNELDNEAIILINEMLNEAYHAFSQAPMMPVDKVDFIVEALYEQADLYEDDNYPVRGYLLQAANDIQRCADEIYAQEQQEEPNYVASSTPASSHYASLPSIFSKPAEQSTHSMLKTMSRDEVEDFLIDQLGISDDAVYEKLGPFLNLYQQNFQSYHQFVVNKDPAHDHFRHSSQHYQSVVVETKGALLAVDRFLAKNPKERTDDNKIGLLKKAFVKILDRVKSNAENAASDQGYRYYRSEWTSLHDLFKKLDQVSPAAKYRR